MMRLTHGLGLLILGLVLTSSSIGARAESEALLDSLTTIFGSLQVIHGAPVVDTTIFFRQYALVQDTLLGEKITMIDKLEDFIPAHSLFTGMRLNIKGRLNLNLNLLGFQVIVALNVSTFDEVDTTGLIKRHNENTEVNVRKPLTVFITTPDSTPAIDIATWNQQYSTDVTSFRNVVARYTNNVINFAQGDTLEITIPTVLSSCNYREWVSQSLSAARAKGYNLANYNHLGMVMSSTLGSKCNYCGLAIVGCLSSGASNCWAIMGCNLPHVIGHEFGHNMGMHHSGNPTAEYGDSSCVMGSGSGNAALNLPQRVRMGYLRSTNGYGNAVTSGTYTITDAYNPSTALAQGLRVPYGSTTFEAYWISWRFLNSDDPVLSSANSNKVFVHHLAPGSAMPILLATLSAGQTFSPSGRQMTFGFVSADTSARRATINVSVGPCVRNAPSVAVAITNNCPPTYSITVKSNDAGSCTPRAYTPASPVATGMASGWTASFTGDMSKIAAGATVVGTLTFKKPLLALTYTGSFTAAWRLVSSQSASYADLTGSINVDFTSPKLTAPRLTASVSGRAPQLSWTGVSYSASGCNSAAVSATFEVFRNNIKVFTTKATSFSDTATGLSGNINYRVEASHEGARSVSNTATVTLTAAGEIAASSVNNVRLADANEATISSDFGDIQRSIAVSVNKGDKSALIINSTEKSTTTDIASYTISLDGINQYNETSLQDVTDQYMFSNIGWAGLSLTTGYEGAVSEIFAVTNDKRVSARFVLSNKELVHDDLGFLEAGVLYVRFAINDFWYDNDLVMTNKSRLALVATIQTSSDIRIAQNKAVLAREAVTISWPEIATVDSDIVSLRAESVASGSSHTIYFSVPAEGKSNIAWTYSIEVGAPNPSALQSSATSLTVSSVVFGLLVVLLSLLF